MKQVFLLILATFFSAGLISAQDNKPDGLTLNQNPEKAEIVVSDLALFWRAYDQAKPENNLIVYRDEYFKKGSVGLQEFLRSKIGNSCNLVTAIDAAPKYYAALRAQSAKVENYKPQMLASFKKLKEIHPDAVFPNVYFVIGRMNTGGTATFKGLLIGVEMYGKTDDASLAELSGWKKSAVDKVERIPFIVAHELVHYQQRNAHLTSLFGGEVNLLGKSLSEGSADFVGELISGGNINQQIHEYANPREKQLWLEFKKEMNGNDASNWLYQGDKAKDKPADLGYYVGYKIVESYYNKAKDKKQAIKDILEIKDFNHFLKASGYDEKFPVE
ncbi:MAG TPA: DUF2268 domain-containing putative Zn-dependent protease [Pyrinomonadaceae bacterium]|nr:DUF2268 domain-containing putative Zn-dependent protease [Pyrinomonadaceae bacterium]